jgi:hypothetical protein
MYIIVYKFVILGGSDGGDDIPDDVTRFGQVRGRLLHLPHGFLPGTKVKHEKTIAFRAENVRISILKRSFRYCQIRRSGKMYCNTDQMPFEVFNAENITHFCYDGTGVSL